MNTIALIAAEEFILSQIGRWYTEILFEAEYAKDSDTRIHGEWLREQIMHKLKNSHKVYN